MVAYVVKCHVVSGVAYIQKSLIVKMLTSALLVLLQFRSVEQKSCCSLLFNIKSERSCAFLHSQAT